MANPKIMKICSHCRGENLLFDAWAAWDFKSQKMELHQTFDAAVCEDCEGETTTLDVTMQ